MPYDKSGKCFVSSRKRAEPTQTSVHISASNHFGPHSLPRSRRVERGVRPQQKQEPIHPRNTEIVTLVLASFHPVSQLKAELNCARGMKFILFRLALRELPLHSVRMPFSLRSLRIPIYATIPLGKCNRADQGGQTLAGISMLMSVLSGEKQAQPSSLSICYCPSHLLERRDSS